MRVSEVADRNHGSFGKSCVLPVDSGAARRAEMKGHRVAAFRWPHPCRGFTGKCDLFAAETRLIADHRTRAALTCQATTHGDARWLSLDRQVELSAATHRVSGGHELAP
jgi:hypothetical protein